MTPPAGSSDSVGATGVELVTLTIDGREVSVPKGTGLVEAALAAGIEIPVFCYEPRLGPPVGACRMCLCEVAPGPPKPQAACTLTAAEGMAVKTALTSELAAESQNATLEFILVNHPLDCPVCDKGGECPLQDLTFRYGPGSTRMDFQKRTFEKPIPISPTIALDRERCILCYRCTRFSESVAEDGQLVAVERGAASMIATFEDEPYRAPFSGNVIELCPVGALTSTQYRFEGRPWEIQNVPTVCGLCPVGCNISATTREGKVKRILSRNHPEIDEGWLCDKGRFAFEHIRAGDRIEDPLRKTSAGFEPLAWNDALDEAEKLLRAAGSAIVTSLSGAETVEQAYGLARLLRVGLDAHGAVLPEEVPDGLDAYRAPLSSIRDAATVVVLCDEPVVERAPVVELWIKAARRNGATIVTELPSPGGPGTVLITDDAERAASLAAAAGAETAFYLPRTPNGRGVVDAWSCAADGEPADTAPKLMIISGDENALNPDVRAMAAHAGTVIGIGMFAESFAGLADLVLPGTSYLERDGTTVNLEGRLQRQRRAVVAPCPDELAWIAKLAERFDVPLSPHAAVVFEEVSATCYGGISMGQVGERAPLPAAPDAVATPGPVVPSEMSLPRETSGDGLRLLTYRPLFSGPAVDRTPELAFQKHAGEVELNPADARSRRIDAGDEVTVHSNGTSRRLRARLARDLAPGTVRMPRDEAVGLHDHVEVTR
ncbi:MAG TPA: 2Fe-2S iron-sulfur cluster-binding protein [Gaiellaceae bacterium]|jgi:NADH dehydrogenase/NADH:ubiquinone oxidoreductase subunit G|nr:2Fe-2S iron-sulfur cluster-binding protein [Gaiellaceae bacterium]